MESTKPLPEGRIGPERQLGTSDNAVQRVLQHSKGLVDDLQQWVELKVELTQLEIMEKVDARINAVAQGVVMAVVGLLALTFFLVAAALGIGEWLGHPAWGFLVVFGVLALILGLVAKYKPRFINLMESVVDDGTAKDHGEKSSQG